MPVQFRRMFTLETYGSEWAGKSLWLNVYDDVEDEQRIMVIFEHIPRNTIVGMDSGQEFSLTNLRKKVDKKLNPFFFTTESSVFERINAEIPESIPSTSVGPEVKSNVSQPIETKSLATPAKDSKDKIIRSADILCPHCNKEIYLIARKVK